MPAAGPCLTENTSRCRNSDSNCMLCGFSTSGPGVTRRLEMLTEEDQSNNMATEGVPTLPKEPEFARKEFSVGVDIATPGVVGGLTGLCTMLRLRDPRAQMRENKMAEPASMS
jgi:hypothetical protein